MDNRERIIRLWFDMWLAKKDLGIFNVFSDNAVYIESWGPEYHGSKKIKLWFEEWNTRGTVLQWDIKQFFHKGNQTIVEWYFKNKMDAGNVEAFDGISLIEWTPDGMTLIKMVLYHISEMKMQSGFNRKIQLLEVIMQNG